MVKASPEPPFEPPNDSSVFSPPIPSLTTENQFLSKLKTLNEINIQLNRTDSFDELCFQGIKLGIERLDFDRLSLWFLEETRRFMCGTFGVDEHGAIRDERQRRFKSGSDASLLFSQGRKQACITHNADLLNDRSEIIGTGWHLSVPLLDGDQFIGFLTADNLINQRPLLDYQAELLQLYGSTIGYLGRSKQEQETVRKLRQAIEQSCSIVILCNVAGRIEYVNPAFTTISGYSGDFMLEKDLEFLIASAGRGNQYAQLWKMLSAGAEWRDEWHNRNQSGGFYDTLVSISPVKNAEGHITHYVIVQEDITESKRREAQEAALRLEREQVNLLQQFIANIAHEFKTPLTVINTKTYLIQRHLGTDAPLEHLRAIEDQVMQTNKMLDDMLLMMKLQQSGKLSLGRVDLNSMLNDQVQKCQKIAAAKNLTWLIELPQPSRLLQADADNLGLALHQILDNAVSFSVTGGVITISAEHLQDRIAIRIKDNGIGMAGDELPHIFAPFYRIDKARTHRGTGLGLSIVKRIVQLHQGTVSISSEPGQGTTVELSFPTQQTTPSDSF